MTNETKCDVCGSHEPSKAAMFGQSTLPNGWVEIIEFVVCRRCQSKIRIAIDGLIDKK